MNDGRGMEASPDFQLVFQSAPTPMMVLAPDGPHFTILAATDAFLQATGMRREAIVGRPVGEVFPETPQASAGGGPGARSSFERVLRQRVPDAPGIRSHERRLPPEAGGGLERRVWRPLNSPVFDTRGELVYIVHQMEDVTAQKRMEAEHKESEERFGTLADNISQLAWMADESGWIFWYNRRWYEYTGTSLEQMQGWGWRAVHHPDHVDHVVEKISDSFRTGTYWEDTFPLRGRDGSYRWFLSRAIPIRDAKGRVVRWFGTNTDVTDLRESEAKYRRLFENMTEEVHLWEVVRDRTGQVATWRLVDANPAALRSWGRRRDAVVGKTTDEIFGPGAGDYYRPVVRKIMSEGRAHVSEELFPPLGRIFRITSVPLGDHFLTTGADVTAERKAQEGLREAQRIARLGNWLWDPASDAVTGSDELLRIFGVDPAAGALPDFSAQRGRCYPVEEWERLDVALRQVLATGKDFALDLQALRGAATIWLTLRGEAVRGSRDRVTGVRGTAQDITERKRAEEMLLRMNAELEEFAYVASHDLKAPLRAVANLALIIDEDAGGRLDPTNRMHLRRMRERVKAMDALIDGLLTYARLGRGADRSRRLALSGLLREVVDSLPLPEGFRVEWEPELPVLYADPVELRQVFQNLIANAADHHDDPSRGHLWIRAREVENSWCLELADDGPGVPEAQRDRIFRMFTSSGKVGHTGIGLAVVRKLVLANGGEVEVTDNRPRGALFRIRWPKR